VNAGKTDTAGHPLHTEQSVCKSAVGQAGRARAWAESDIDWPQRTAAGFVLCCLLGTVPALAAQGPIHAVRTPEAPKLDGRVDDPVWQRAPVFTDFLESYPQEGATPTFRTEVRVLYDDRTLFVSVVSRDPHPELVQRQLGRRDTNPLVGDLVEVEIDSTHDRRTGYYFAVNAAGVLRDALLYGDVNMADTWDGVWDAAVFMLPDGWSAELAIPLDLLRFPRAPTQEWGFLVRRTVHRTHQVFDSQMIPKSANGLVSRFGTLTGLDGLTPRRAFQLTPYVTGRLSIRPQYTDPAYPSPRLVSPSADVGADLRTTLTSDLTLNAAINPDFGQVEQDQVVLNLSNQEVFYPEKRPFFNQGLELFQPVGVEYFINGQPPPQQLFYSRRIGLDTPILAAAKVTGTGWKGLDIGLLDAVVMGVADPGKRDVAYLDDPDPDDPWVHLVEGKPDRRLQFHAQRPLHLGLNDELPREPPVSRNYFAFAARQTFLGNSSVGVTLTSANPLSARCTEADIQRQTELQAQLAKDSPGIVSNSEDPINVRDCQGYGGTTAGIDFNLRSRNSEWLALGALNASRRIGGPANDALRDGTVMHPGDLGAGGYFMAGKFGGEGIRADIGYRYATPRLDLNALGYLQSQNQQAFLTNLRYYRSRGIGSLHELQAVLFFSTWWSTDGRWTPRGNYAGLDTSVILPGYQQIGFFVNAEIPRYDVREIDGYGVPFERRGDVVLGLYGGTDPNRPVVLTGFGYLFRTFNQGPTPPQTGGGGQLTLFVRPKPWWETQLIGQLDIKPQGPRFIDCTTALTPAPPPGTTDPRCAGDGFNDHTRNTFLFGAEDAKNFSLTLRQTFVFTPRLTLQIYGQLFSAGGQFGQLYVAEGAAGDRIHLTDLKPTSTRPTDIDDPNFHDATLNLNVVLRWEYRLGSTLFLVYSRSQSALGLTRQIDPVSGEILHQQAPTHGLAPLRLGPGPTVDTFQVKWSYFWDA
jgi:hypothetical protein